MKNYSNASRATFETLRGIPYTAIEAGYIAFGDPYANPVRILDIFNDMDQPLLISFDGVNAAVYLPAHSGRIYDFGANRQAAVDQLEQPKDTQVYVEYFNMAPTLGYVFLTVIYASND